MFYGVIRKEAWSFYMTIFGVHLCWELEEPKGPKGRIKSKTPTIMCFFLVNALYRGTYAIVGDAFDAPAPHFPLGPLGSSSSQHRRTPEIVL